MSDTHFQAIVIGAGPGGYPCAIRLGQLGVKTLIVEKKYWGGVCLNVGCIPSKALITAGKKLEGISKAGDMGIRVSGEATVDMPALIGWKDKVVTKLTNGVQTLLKGNKVSMAFGTAHISAKGKVTVSAEGGDTVYTADHIVVATGSQPVQIPGFEFADEPIISSAEALALQEVPDHLIVIGGGVIGMEMGMMYRKLGAQVTVVEMLDTILPGQDKDAVRLLGRFVKKAKITLHTKSKALGWEVSDGGVTLHVETPKGKIAIEGDKILVTVGRRPNSKGLGLEELGATFDGPFVQVNERLETSVPGIYAIGDVVGQPMLAHKATHEGEVVAEVIAGHKVQLDHKQIPSVIFTDPEIACAGMSEAQAKEAGHEVRVGKLPFAALGRALAMNDTNGFYKLVIDATTHKVLGVTIIGPHASDLISEACLAIEMDAEALDIGLTIHPHPTLGEGMMEAAKAAMGEAIHILNK